MNPRDIPFVHTHLAIFSFFPGMRVHTFLIYIYITNYAIDISSYIISLFLILIILLFLFSPIFSSLILIYLFLEVAAHPVLLSIVVVSLLLATSRTVFLLLRCQWLSVLSRLPLLPPPSPSPSCHFTLRPCAVNVTRHTIPFSPSSTYAYNDSPIIPCRYAFRHPMTENERFSKNREEKLTWKSKPFIHPPLSFIV